LCQPDETFHRYYAHIQTAFFIERDLTFITGQNDSELCDENSIKHSLIVRLQHTAMSLTNRVVHSVV